VDANALSSELIQIVSLCECDGRQVIETCLRPLPVVEQLNIFADSALGLLACLESLMIDQFIFQRSPKRFNGCVIEAIAPATHGRLHTELADQRLIRVSAILLRFKGSLQHLMFMTQVVDLLVLLLVISNQGFYAVCNSVRLRRHQVRAACTG
jgi:hypothetical protein